MISCLRFTLAVKEIVNMTFEPQPHGHLNLSNKEYYSTAYSSTWRTCIPRALPAETITKLIGTPSGPAPYLIVILRYIGSQLVQRDFMSSPSEGFVSADFG